MVETRASRRAAEEDSGTSSQPVRPRSRTRVASEGGPPSQDLKSRTRSQTACEDSFSSVQAPVTPKGRSRSTKTPQKVARTPRTRSRTRKEAEESIASSEVRVSTPHPKISEEDSHDLRSKTPAKKVVTTRKNQTSESVSNDASSQAPPKQKGGSRATNHPPSPAQTPRTRSRARKEAEESFASSGVGASVVHPHSTEDNSHDLRSKTPAAKDAPGPRNQTFEILSDGVSAPSRRIRTVARRTHAFGAKNSIPETEEERLSRLSSGTATKRSRSQRVVQSVTSDVRPQLLLTPDPQNNPSSSTTQCPRNESEGNEDVLSTAKPIVPRGSIDLEHVDRRAEQQIQATEPIRSKAQSPAFHCDVTSRIESDEKQVSIAGFKSNKPLITDPEGNGTLGESKLEYREAEAGRPISKHSVQAELVTYVNAQTPGERPKITTGDDDRPSLAPRPEISLAIPSFPADFDGFKHDEVRAIPVEDDEPPPPPQLVEGSEEATDDSQIRQPRSTQQSDMNEEDKKMTHPSAHSIGNSPNQSSPPGKANKAASKVITNLVAEDDAPSQCDAELPKKAFEIVERADASVGTPQNGSEKPVEGNGTMPEASRSRREQNAVPLKEGHHANGVPERLRPEVRTEQACEDSQQGEQNSESPEDGTENNTAPILHDRKNEKRAKDTLKKMDTSITDEQVLNKDSSTVKESAISGDSLREKDLSDPLRVIRKENAFKVSSVDDILKVDERNISVFFHRDMQTSKMCRKLLSQHYAQQTKLEFGSDARYQFIPKRRKLLPPMGPLAQIEVGDHFDSDQVWEELELRNKPLLSYLRRKVNAAGKQNKDADRALRRVMMNDDDSGSECRELELTTKGKKQVGKKDSRGVEIGENDEGQVVLQKEKEPEEERGQRKTVQFAETLPPSRSAKRKEERGVGENIGDKEVKTKKKRRRLEDGFFSIVDMDRFADEAEELALSGKLVASDDDRDPEAMSDDSEDEVEEIEVEDKLGRYLYSDFFDPPTKVSGSDKGVVKMLRLLDDDELSESASHQEDRGNEGEIADSTAGESDAMAEDNAGNAELTPLQRMRARSTKRIKVLEEASVAKKSWELRGEVSAFARPKDSLLDTEMQHDIAVKPKAFLSNEINESIEEVIKQRIVDGLFDDVVMRLPEEYIAKKSKKSREELPEISQEKPTEGLAEMYAKEFKEEREKKDKEMLSSQAVQKELDEPLGEQQREVNRLFEKLSKKLDALSNLHYTPIPDDAKADVTVKTNVRAVVSEEAIPEGVSSANLLAPKEVYSVDKKDLVGEKELDKEERRAARRQRKSKRRKTQAADASRKEASAQADPVLAEKRRAEAALIRRGKKPRLAESDPKLAGRSSTKNLIKRFGVVTNPGMNTSRSQRRKSASHFRL